MMLLSLFSILTVLAFVAGARAYAILPDFKPPRRVKRQSLDKCSLAVFLGSGGHTTEALTLISTLDFTRYTPRTYIISDGDTLSAQKAADLERAKAGDGESEARAAATVSRQRHAFSTSNDGKDYRILTIPRARRVHQPLYTTPPSVLVSILSCIYHITYLPLRTSRIFSEVLVLNGPGTCFALCMAAYLSRFLGIPSPRLIYVESFARVKTLSLSGKLLRPIVDRFIVQWPDALADGGRGECRGWLV